MGGRVSLLLDGPRATMVRLLTHRSGSVTLVTKTQTFGLLFGFGKSRCPCCPWGCVLGKVVTKGAVGLISIGLWGRFGECPVSGVVLGAVVTIGAVGLISVSL